MIITIRFKPLEVLFFDIKNGRKKHTYTKNTQLQIVLKIFTIQHASYTLLSSKAAMYLFFNIILLCERVLVYCVYVKMYGNK